MKKGVKIWLLIAAILCSVGVTVGVIAWAAVDFDLMKLDTADFVDNVYEFDGYMDGIHISFDTANIRFGVSPDSVVRVFTHEKEDNPHTVQKAGGKLLISRMVKPWYQKLGFSFEEEWITIHLPKDVFYLLTAKVSTADVVLPSGLSFSGVNIETDTGDVHIASSVRGSILVEADYGDVLLENTNPKHIEIETDTGDVTLKNTLCRYDLSITTDTGDIRFDRVDAQSLTIETDTGDVEGTLLSDKTFDVTTDTGRKKYPKETVGGLCKITTDTGDIVIDIVK